MSQVIHRLNIQKKRYSVAVDTLPDTTANNHIDFIVRTTNMFVMLVSMDFCVSI